MMVEKQRLEEASCSVRLKLQRLSEGYGPQPEDGAGSLSHRLSELKQRVFELDDQVAPRAREAVQVANSRWGPLLRAGNDKSHLARQVEASADIYTSRVSNFVYATPFAYLRSVRGSMPHDPTLPAL
jgi:hypothetical protein